MKELVFTIILSLSTFFIQAQQMGSFTDPRDGQTYKIVTLSGPFLDKGITIMAENLNYKLQGSYAYNNDERYRKNLGLLYTWDAAMRACPRGWHLASDDDWTRIVQLIGREDEAGKAMKATAGWIENGNGTNSSGLNMLPGGSRTVGDELLPGGGSGSTGSFYGLGEIGLWWSSSLYRFANQAWERTLYYGDSKVYKSLSMPFFLCSCRCVRD